LLIDIQAIIMHDPSSLKFSTCSIAVSSKSKSKLYDCRDEVRFRRRLLITSIDLVFLALMARLLFKVSCTDGTLFYLKDVDSLESSA
jgi:hypothetical protein